MALDEKQCVEVAQKYILWLLVDAIHESDDSVLEQLKTQLHLKNTSETNENMIQCLSEPYRKFFTRSVVVLSNARLEKRSLTLEDFNVLISSLVEVGQIHLSEQEASK